MLFVFLLLPFVALVHATSFNDMMTAVGDAMFRASLWLSIKTTVVSLVVTLLCGTPLAWWLATTKHRGSKLVETLVELPIVMPPAVVGVALLMAFGRRGLLGPAAEAVGLEIAFTTTAVVIAQVAVSSPFYVQAASNAFRRVNPDTILVARTLGASRIEAFFRVALPIALPGLVVGASLAWARALGEFGATLLFAGNMTAVTQTMPLAIFTALETDVQLAVVFALLLAATGGLLLVTLRAAPEMRRR